MTTVTKKENTLTPEIIAYVNERNEIIHRLELVEQTIKHQNEKFDMIIHQMEKNAAQVDRRFEEMLGFMDKRFEQVDKRFEQVDKRFEQVDKRFEQVDKRFEDNQHYSDQRFKDMQDNINKRFSQQFWTTNILFSIGVAILSLYRFMG